MRALPDRYGFLFWLRWITWFAGSFVAAALFWTSVLKGLFGKISGTELSLTWVVCVFGSWLLLIIPFMRKKEQIWKRLNEDQERAVDAFFRGIGLWIALVMGSFLLWSIFYRRAILEGTAGRLWIRDVLTTSLLGLLPLLVWMYRKADELFQRAHERQTYVPNYHLVTLDLKERLLPENIAERLKKMPPTMPKGHVVTFYLKNGEKVPHVFVYDCREILGIYDQENLGFEPKDIKEVEGIALEKLPVYEEKRWRRFKE